MDRSETTHELRAERRHAERRRRNAMLDPRDPDYVPLSDVEKDAALERLRLQNLLLHADVMGDALKDVDRDIELMGKVSWETMEFLRDALAQYNKIKGK